MEVSKTEDRMHSNQSCAPEGQMLEWWTQHGGIYEAELVKENKDVS